MSLRPAEVFAGYTVERELGAGGMGSVYLAHHPRLPRFDALKLLRSELCADPGFVGRFEREADTVAQLDHPNIVPVYDRGSQDGQLWISMRFIDGTNAEKALDEYEHGMPPERAVRIVSKVAAALDYAHKHQLLHRDVKPANILLAGGPEDEEDAERVFLSDFGVAKAIGEAAERVSSLTSTGSVVATLDYASPEQIKGLVLDHRSDIYALGCVLYKLLTGTVPFPGDSVAARVYGHLNNIAPAPSTLVPALPSGFDDVVAKAIAKEAADRYPTCRALAVAARAALTSPVGPIEPPRAQDQDLPTTITAPGHLGDVPRRVETLPPWLGRVPGTRPEYVPPTPAVAPPDTGPRPAPLVVSPRPRRRGIVIAAGAAAVLIVGAAVTAFLVRGNTGGTASLAPTTAGTTSQPVPGLPHSTPLAGQTLLGSRTVDGVTNLYQLDALSGDVGQQITTGGAGAAYPVLSPDRGSMVYLQTSAAGTSLRVAAVDGSADRSLFATPPTDCATLGRPAWNPAEQTELAVPCTTAAGTTQVRLISVDGTPVGTVGTGLPFVDDLAYSPDGTNLTYWGTDIQGGPGTIYTQPADSSAPPKRLLERPDGASDADPVYSADGATIAFRRAVEGGDGGLTAQIVVVGADGSNPLTLTDDAAIDQDPIFSPDGGQIAFRSNRPSAAGAADNQIWVMSADGQGQKQLAVGSPGTADGAPAWGHR